MNAICMLRSAMSWVSDEWQETNDLCMKRSKCSDEYWFTKIGKENENEKTQ